MLDSIERNREWISSRKPTNGLALILFGYNFTFTRACKRFSIFNLAPNKYTWNQINTVFRPNHICYGFVYLVLLHSVNSVMKKIRSKVRFSVVRFLHTSSYFPCIFLTHFYSVFTYSFFFVWVCIEFDFY